MTIPKLLSTDEVAAMLGVKRNTLERWRVFGHGPRFVKFSKSAKSAVRYRSDVVEAWINEQTADSTTAHQQRSADA